MAISDFGKAFRAARSAGKKEFSWNGKSYHTRTADEEKAAKAKSSAPKAAAKPAQSKQARLGVSTPATQQSRPAPAAAKAKSSPAENYRKMAASPGGVPGKKSATPAKATPAEKPKYKTYGRSRNTVILNSPKNR
jgi:hypothetical protein